jgi:uncharacterized UBP type Zn finger protein
MQGKWLKISPFSLCWVRLTYDRHYVAVVRKPLSGQSGLSWVMFNDEKVVKFEDIEAMKKSAYLYFFTRV